MHGHDDLGHLEFHAYGNRLLWSPGVYAFDGGARRSFCRGRGSHNVVDVPSATYDRTVPAQRVAAFHSTAVDMQSVLVTSLAGATWNRRVLYSRTGDYLLVDDRVHQSSPRLVVQRWNLEADRSVSASRATGRTVTAGTGANLAVLQVAGRPTLTVYKGAVRPRTIGWRSLAYRAITPTSALEASSTDTNVRFITVLVPLRRGRPGTDAAASAVQIGSSTVSLVVRNGNHVERALLTPTYGSVRVLP